METTPTYTMISPTPSIWNPLDWFTNTIIYADIPYNDSTFCAYQCMVKGLNPWIRKVIKITREADGLSYYLVLARVGKRKSERYGEMVDAAYRAMELHGYDPIAFINELIQESESDQQ